MHAQASTATRLHAAYRPQCQATAMKVRPTFSHFSAQGEPRCLHESCVRACLWERESLPQTCPTAHTPTFSLFICIHTHKAINCCCHGLNSRFFCVFFLFSPTRPHPLLDHHKHFSTPWYMSYAHVFINSHVHRVVLSRGWGQVG